MKKILLADDSLTIQKVVELTFLDEDYEVESVGSGDDARASLAEDVDILITDIHVPGASGYELCQEAKAARPGLPVLLLVGTFETLDEDLAEAVGADGHLQKPFDAQELLGTVERLVAAAAGDDAADEGSDGMPHHESADGEAEGDGVEALFEAPADDDPESALDSDLAITALPEEAPEQDSAGEDSGDEPAEPYGPPGDQEAAGVFTGDPGLEDLPDLITDEAPVEIPGEETAPVAAAAAAEPDTSAEVTDDLVERVARRVVELLGDDVLREVAWEVVPDLAEVVVKERLRELEAEIE